MNKIEKGLVDYFDRDANTLDIRSNGMYPSGVLSNLCSNAFRIDGVLCNSMEGFLQSLKHQDPTKQRQLCQLKGGNARKRSVNSWQTDQIVWWREQAIDRQSNEYQLLLLMATRGITLIHTTGETNPYKTILTASEFCRILTELRDNYDIRDKQITTKKRIYKDADGQLYELVPLPSDYNPTPDDEVVNCKINASH